MIVYGSTMSPFVRKLMAYAGEKGLSLDLKAAGMGRGGPDFDEASPFAKMPAFRDHGADDGRDFCLTDSTAIIAYLEAKYPEPNMIPVEARARGRTIWFEEFADTILIAAGSKIFFNRFVAPRVLKRPGDEAIAAAAEANDLPPLFDYLEGVIPDSGFLVEDRITLADIAVASPFVNFRHLALPIDPDRWPRTCHYVDTILARPSIAPMIERETAQIAKMV